MRFTGGNLRRTLNNRLRAARRRCTFSVLVRLVTLVLFLVGSVGWPQTSAESGGTVRHSAPRQNAVKRKGCCCSIKRQKAGCCCCAKPVGQRAGCCAGKSTAANDAPAGEAHQDEAPAPRLIVTSCRCDSAPAIEFTISVQPRLATTDMPVVELVNSGACVPAVCRVPQPVGTRPETPPPRYRLC